MTLSWHCSRLPVKEFTMAAPITILDHPIVSGRYFFPRKTALPDPYWVTAGDGIRLACSYHFVSKQANTLIYFHGNGEVVADYLPHFADWIIGAGYNLLLAEYRGYGQSQGEPILAGMLEDVVACIQALQTPPEKIVLFGRSLGSLYVLHGVHKYPRIGGLIIESGIANLGERFFDRVSAEELGVPKQQIKGELNKYFNFAEKLSSFHGKTLILHARLDELVSIQNAEDLYSAASESKQLHVFNQGGHNDIFFRNRAEYMQLVEAFLAGI